jgi:hypothetical protein
MYTSLGGMALVGLFALLTGQAVDAADYGEAASFAVASLIGAGMIARGDNLS